MQTNPNKNTHTVDQLNSFLRGELSAVETYQQALQKLEGFAHRSTLQECATSHQRRATLLVDEVRKRGGEPAKTSGAWGTFAKAVEGSSATLGAKIAIAALEEGEDHGRNDYDRDVDKLDTDAREFVAHSLMPEQLRTHRAMSDLKKRLD